VLTAQDALNGDQTKQQGSIQTAQNSVDQAQAALNKANASFQTTIASQSGSIQTAQNSLDQARAALATQQATFVSTTAGPTQPDVDSANAAVANAQTALQTAQNNLAAAVLTAPSSGTIQSINGVVGQYISGGVTSSVSTSSTATSTTSTSAFITLSDLSTPQVSAAVSEADIAKVQPGQKVTFTVTAYPSRTFTGTVATVEPAGTTSSNVVTYTVLISVDPTDAQLLPGMTATVTVVTSSADNAVLVPNAAISNGNVRVLRDGSPVSVPVQTGISDGVNTQIISGLQPDDQVITGTVSTSKSSTSSGSTSRSSSIFGFGGPPR
jgi:RND family efflux transporter MFP subunit